MMTDEQIKEILRCDFSKGTERFRDDLLARCLAVLNEDDEEDGTAREDVADDADDDGYG